MEFLASLIIIPVAVLIRTKVFILILLVIIGYQLIVKKNLKSMYRHVFSYLISISLVIGIPYGIAKMIVPDEANEAETQIVKEVEEWLPF
jgi:ABC-type proline/glycine betaine transport system permease subunit